MAVSKRSPLVLTAEEEQQLNELCGSRTAPVRDVQRAQILWLYHRGKTVSEIARELRTSPPSVRKWVDKALQMGVKAGLRDTPHQPRDGDHRRCQGLGVTSGV